MIRFALDTVRHTDFVNQPSNLMLQLLYHNAKGMIRSTEIIVQNHDPVEKPDPIDHGQHLSFKMLVF